MAMESRRAELLRGSMKLRQAQAAAKEPSASQPQPQQPQQPQGQDLAAMAVKALVDVVQAMRDEVMKRLEEVEERMQAPEDRTEALMQAIQANTEAMRALGALKPPTVNVPAPKMPAPASRVRFERDDEGRIVAAIKE